MKYKRIKGEYSDYIISFETIIKREIVKESDDMADLFDKFVKVSANDKPYLISRHAYEMYKPVKTGEVQTNILPFKIYGAVWTREGLHYVAEYTKEGEWELL